MPQIRANGIQLHYEDDGDPSDPAVLMVMGLGAQLILWPEGLWRPLVDAGFRVIRFDNRDVGLSQRLEDLPTPSAFQAGLNWQLGRTLRPPYSLQDMADDTLGLADALGLERWHLVGASMGGMIAQLIAAAQPQRLLSLSLIMSSPGGRGLPGPKPRVALRLMHRPRGTDREALIRYSMRTWRLVGSRTHPADPDELRQRTEQHVDRSYYPAGYKRQFVASLASGSRTALCQQIRVPTHVWHGLEDPLIPPAHGQRLADLIPGAALSLVPGMGHDFPRPLRAELAQQLIAHCRCVAPAQPAARR